MKNNTSFNVLATFASTGKDKRFNNVLMSLSSQHVINWMIDSGAFTKFNAKNDYDFITLDNYCEYLQKYGENSEKYVMLDVIGNATESRRNYEIMVKRGLKPMFVATMYDKDYSYIESTFDINTNICVAGGSLCAYFCSQKWDVYIFHRIRERWLEKHDNKHRWIWNNASTLTAQAIDTIIYASISFGLGVGMFFRKGGLIELGGIMIGQYLLKACLALIDTPIFYALTERTKKE